MAGCEPHREMPLCRTISSRRSSTRHLRPCQPERQDGGGVHAPSRASSAALAGRWSQFRFGIMFGKDVPSWVPHVFGEGTEDHTRWRVCSPLHPLGEGIPCAVSFANHLPRSQLFKALCKDPFWQRSQSRLRRSSSRVVSPPSSGTVGSGIAA
jgi:hypothetical protein